MSQLNAQGDEEPTAQRHGGCNRRKCDRNYQWNPDTCSCEPKCPDLYCKDYESI